jgi:hypothetical protein
MALSATGLPQVPSIVLLGTPTCPIMTVRQKLAQFILTGDWVSIFCPVRCNHKREPNKKSSTEYSGELRGIIQDERDAQDAFSRRSRPRL